MLRTCFHQLTVAASLTSLALFAVCCDTSRPKSINSANEGAGSGRLWHVSEEKPAAALALVRLEIEEADLPAWAGFYVKGAGTESDRLCLAPDSGWVYVKGLAKACCSTGAESHCGPDCPGAREAHNGEVFETRLGTLKLALDLGQGQVVLFGEFLPVSWGSRRYLIPIDERSAFEDAVAKGMEPRNAAEGAFYLAQGDEHHLATGKPQFGENVAGK